MKNLKRVLSMAMATVMMMGMMTVGASALSYPDVDAADNAAAIEILKAVGIMEGDENGNFNPDKLVTRNEMAVIMCKLLDLKVGGTSKFWDVPAWAQGYVNACYNNGIIAGTSENTFSGNANVTAAQAALMTMKALGYFGYQGEFGNDWQLAVVKQATKIDLFSDINAGSTDALTRNEVAQLVLNALESDVVVVHENQNITVEGAGVNVQVTSGYDYENYAKDREKHNYDGIGEGDERHGRQQLVEKLFGSDLKKDGDGQDDFGRPATVWTYKNNEIKVADQPTLVYTGEVKMKAIYADLGKPSGLKGDTITNLYEDGVEVNDDRMSAKFSNDDDTKIAKGNGVITEVYYDDDEDEVDIVLINTYLAEVVSDYDDDAEELEISIFADADSDAETLDLDDFDESLKDYKEDDYVLVTMTRDGEDKVQTIEPAELVEAVKISAVKNEKYVVAEGETYKFNYHSAVVNSDALGYEMMLKGDDIDLNSSTYDLYLDNNGFVVGMEEHDDEYTPDDYVFVDQKGSADLGSIDAKVYFLNGLKKTITIAEVDGYELDDRNEKDKAVAALKEGYFYEFKELSNGEYELTSAEKDGDFKSIQVEATIEGDTSKPLVDEDGKKYDYVANNKTVFLTDNAVKVGIKNALDVDELGSVGVLLDDDGKTILAMITDKDGKKSVTDLSEVIYILDNKGTSGQDADDNDYYILDAIVDGEKTEVKFNGTKKDMEDIFGSFNFKGVWEITSYENDYVDDVKKHDSLVANVKEIEYDDGVMTVKGDTTKAVYLEDETVVYLINDDDDSVRTIAHSSLDTNTANKGLKQVVVLHEDNDPDEDVLAVYVIVDR